MTITSSSFAKLLYPGLSSIYGQAYDEWPVEYSALFDQESSTRAYEEDIGLTGFGLAQVKTEGQSITYDDMEQAYITRYAHLVWGLGFVITREVYEDDLYDVVGKRKAKSLAFSLRQTMEIVHANVYNRAFTSTFTGGDGKELLATDHPNYSGGTWSNELSSAANLSEAALEQAVIDIGGWENDRGMKIAVIPQSLHIPYNLEFVAARILQTPYRVNSANNDINALRFLGKFPKGVHMNHYFDSTKAWFIRTNVQDGLKSFTRRPMEFGVDNDFDTENAKYKATVRFSAGWTDPKALFGSPGV
jgi:hypothetical protein